MQLSLLPDDSKGVDDYPLIAHTYSQCHDLYLHRHLHDFTKRSQKLVQSPWERKFCHLHIEAINREIAKRQLA